MIDREHELGVSRQAQLLCISRGAVYYQPRPVSQATLTVMHKIDRLHLAHPFMGARMLVRHLNAQGLTVGRCQVRTLMRRMGIKAMCPQANTSKPCPGHKVYPYLLRDVAITQANQVWALDTTYIPMAQGFVYLCAVMDVASRMVLAHKVSTTLEACHAVEIIEEAFNRYGIPQIVNTDQGSQFTAGEFTRAVLPRGCQLSMDGKGAWRDNVFVERLWRTVKYEEVYLHAYDTVTEARYRIAKFLADYNQERPHSSLTDDPRLVVTPDATYRALQKAQVPVSPVLPGLVDSTALQRVSEPACAAYVEASQIMPSLARKTKSTRRPRSSIGQGVSRATT